MLEKREIEKLRDLLAKYIDERICEIIQPTGRAKDPSDTVALLWHKFELEYLKQFTGSSTPLTHTVFREFLHWLDDTMEELEKVLKAYSKSEIDKYFENEIQWATDINVFYSDTDKRFYIELLDQNGQRIGTAFSMPLISAAANGGVIVEIDASNKTYNVSLQTGATDNLGKHYFKTDRLGGYVECDTVTPTNNDGVDIADVDSSLGKAYIKAPYPFIPNEAYKTGSASRVMGTYKDETYYFPEDEKCTQAGHYTPAEDGETKTYPQLEDESTREDVIITGIKVDRNGHIIGILYKGATEDSDITTPEKVTVTLTTKVIDYDTNEEKITPKTTTVVGCDGDTVDVDYAAITLTYNEATPYEKCAEQYWKDGVEPSRRITIDKNVTNITYIFYVRKSYVLTILAQGYDEGGQPGYSYTNYLTGVVGKTGTISLDGLIKGELKKVNAELTSWENGVTPPNSYTVTGDNTVTYKFNYKNVAKEEELFTARLIIKDEAGKQLTDVYEITADVSSSRFINTIPLLNKANDFAYANSYTIKSWTPKQPVLRFEAPENVSIYDFICTMQVPETTYAEGTIQNPHNMVNGVQNINMPTGKNTYNSEGYAYIYRGGTMRPDTMNAASPALNNTPLKVNTSMSLADETKSFWTLTTMFATEQGLLSTDNEVSNAVELKVVWSDGTVTTRTFSTSDIITILTYVFPMNINNSETRTGYVVDIIAKWNFSIIVKQP